MKASDSTNSLDALYPEEPECFVCLESANNEKNEPVVHGNLLRTCGCKFMVHPTCWNQWIRDKTDFDCPICRKESLVKLRIGIPPNPVLAIAYEEPRSRRQNGPCLYGLGFCILVVGICFLIAAIAVWG